MDDLKSNNPEVVSSSLTNGIALQLILQFFTISKATSIENDESRRWLFLFPLKSRIASAFCHAVAARECCDSFTLEDAARLSDELRGIGSVPLSHFGPQSFEFPSTWPSNDGS